MERAAVEKVESSRSSAIDRPMRPAGPQGPLGLVTALQRSAGNAATARLLALQRDDDSSGGPAPPPEPAAKTQDQLADEALADFSQGKFRDIDWTQVPDTAKKLRLIEKATDPGWLWVGPRDEAAIERCWASMGAAFEAAVQANTIAWNRSLVRGADPENIPQTKGKLAAFTADISAAASKNLEANEDRIVDEFLSFGIQPPWDLVRASQPKRGKLDNTPAAGGTTTRELLEAQSRAARVAAHLDFEQKRLSASWVGLGQNYDPSRPNPDRELQLGNGQTMWTVVDTQLREVSLLLATIVNTWPVLYGAWTAGTLEVIAERKFDSADPLDPKTAEQQEAGLADVKTNLTRSIEAVHSLRENPLNPLDMLPVERGLFSGALKPASGQVPNRDVMLGIMSDVRADRDFEKAVVDRAIDVVIAASVIAATVATGGGVAVAMAAAGANVLKAGAKAGIADTRAAQLQDAQNAAVSQSGVIVDRSTVSIAEIEAQNARVDVVVTAVQSLQDLGVAAFSPHIPESEAPRVRAATEGASEGEGGVLGKMRAAAGAAETSAMDTSPKKEWGIPQEFRAGYAAEPANLRLEGEMVPRVDAVPDPTVPENEMRFNAGTWTVEINPGWLAGTETTVNRFNSMIEVLYHEARHAWQTFQVARWRLMKGGALKEERPWMIPPEVEAAAQKQPMLPGDPLEAQAAAWHESQWGGGADAREATLAEWDFVGGELERQRTRVEGLAADAPDSTRVRENHQLESLRNGYDTAMKKYMALPEEVDAYKEGWARGDWAKAGLDQRYRLRVDAALTQVKSAHVRVATTAEEVALYRVHNASAEALTEAEQLHEAAVLEAQEAEEGLNRARASR